VGELAATGQTTRLSGTVPPEPAWLNRNVVGMGVTSLFSDAGHEMITVLLPGFLTVRGFSSAALGTVEGVADSVSSFVKLGSGWVSDRLGHRKGMAVGGYLLTGVSNGLFALANGWPLVLAARTVGWFGRGFRTPLRNAMLASSVPAQFRGKAFGFERAGGCHGRARGWPCARVRREVQPRRAPRRRLPRGVARCSKTRHPTMSLFAIDKT
jgi:MFS family permease